MTEPPRPAPSAPAPQASAPGHEASPAYRSARLVSVLCHDLRSPLSSIVMGADFLKRSLSKQEGMASEKRVVDSLARSAGRLGALITDLHDLSRIEAGRLELDPSSVEVGELLRDGEPRLRGLGETKGVTISVQAPTSKALLEVDRDRIVQAIAELVENAVRYSPPKGTIEVSADVAEDRVVFTVKDEGPGMSQAQLAHAFDHTFHASQSPRDGTGLGLALVRGIAVAHGGSASAHVAAGSTVSFWVPARRPDDALAG